jgi:hypothetical protein
VATTPVKSGKTRPVRPPRADQKPVVPKGKQPRAA